MSGKYSGSTSTIASEPPKVSSSKPRFAANTVKQAAPISSGQNEFGTLEEEIANNPDMMNDPDELRRLLTVKIGKLGDTIRQVQNQNFVIEDDVIERLRLLKGFNDQMERLNT